MLVVGIKKRSMVKSKITIQEEEILSENIFCLYDKTDAGYKDKIRKINAWEKVEEALGYEEGNI